MTRKGPRLRLIVVAVLVLAGVGAFLWFADGRSRARQLAEARQAAAERDFNRAGILLKAYLKEHANDSDALLLAAQTARRAGSLVQAGEYLRAFERAGGAADAAAHEDRLRRAQMGDPSEVEALLRECEARPGAPDNFPVLEAIVSGSRAILEGREGTPERGAGQSDTARAMRAADLLLDTPMGSADRAEAYLWSGVIHRVALRYPRAVADLRKAVELAPAHFEARRALALTISLESPAEARTHYEVLARERPDDLRVRYELASLYRSLGQTAEAGRLLDELLRAHPDDVQLLVERGNVELDAGRPDRAESWLRQAAARTPESPGLLSALSRCLRAQGNTAEADRLIRRAQELQDRQATDGH